MATLSFSSVSGSPGVNGSTLFKVQVWTVPTWGSLGSGDWYSPAALTSAGVMVGESANIDLTALPSVLDITVTGWAEWMVIVSNKYMSSTVPGDKVAEAVGLSGAYLTIGAGVYNISSSSPDGDGLEGISPVYATMQSGGGSIFELPSYSVGQFYRADLVEYTGWIGYIHWSGYDADITDVIPVVTEEPPTYSTIRPAPERLPHTINIKDTKGNINLQKKLQDNFDAIERQLLALEPDRYDSDPTR